MRNEGEDYHGGGVMLRRLGCLLALLVALAGLAGLLGAAAARASAAASAYQAPTTIANQSGRLATISLTSLGHKTSALYAFVSSGSSFTKRLFWKSARGRFDASKAKLVCGDLNCDGYPDALVLFNRGHGRCALYVFLSTGTKFVKTTAWQGRLNWSTAKLAVADINGDGLADLYVLSRVSTSKSCVYAFLTKTRATASQTGPIPVVMSKTTASPAAPYLWSHAQIAATDVNGDGKADLVSLYRVSATQARLDAFLSSGAKLRRTTFWQGSLATARAKLAAGDVSGDGKGDALVLANAGAGRSALQVFASSGSAFSAPATWWTSAGALPWNRSSLACGDVTGDGRSDAVLLSRVSASRSRFTVAVSSGSAFTGSSFWSGALRYGRTRLACAPSLATIVPTTTQVLSAATVAGASTADGSTYDFTDTSQTDGLAPGDVIVAAPVPPSPRASFARSPPCSPPAPA
jgi:Tfp pilus assembly protein FimT